MNNIVRNAVNIIFGLLAFIFVVIVSLGINLDFAQLKTASFWLEVFIKWVLTMIIFNIVFEYDGNTRAHDINGRFYKAFATLKIRIRQIHKNKLYEPLESAISAKNTALIKELWTARIHKVCGHLNYDDLFNSEKTAEEIAADVRLTDKKKIKRLKKLTQKIRGGEPYKHYGLFPYKPITEEYFLKDNELSKISVDKFDYSHGKEIARRNATKTITFLFTSIISAIITYSLYTPNFWSEFVANLLTMACAIVAGFATSLKDIRLRTQVYENRNDFLERYLGLKDEWGKNKPVESEE